jgi:hypothetical protein
MNNITLVDSKPSLARTAGSVLGLSTWCPKEAFQSGRIIVNKNRYYHPDVKIADMVKQKHLDS